MAPTRHLCLIATALLSLSSPLPAQDGYAPTTPGKPGSGALTPRLRGFGEAAPNGSDLLLLDDAWPLSVGTWVLGLSQVAVSFKGGILGPAVDVILPGLPTDDAGRTELPITYPGSVLLGMQAWVQAWIADPGAGAGLSASNTLGVTIQPGPGAAELFLAPSLWHSGDLQQDITSDVVFEDVDGDGLPDAVVSQSLAGRVIVLRNLGHGLLDEALSLDIGAAADKLLFGDVDGDGHDDLVITTEPPQSLFLLHGQAGLGFGAPVVFAADPPLAKAVAVGDVDGDGRADIVVVDAENMARTWSDDGQGGLVSGPSTHAGDDVRVAELADMDGDGLHDLLVTRMAAADTLSVLPSLGDGTFGARLDSPSGSNDPLSLGLGDLDADGHLDAVVGHVPGWTAVLLGQGTGTLSTAGLYAGGGYVRSVRVADLDHDGHADVATVGDSSGLDLRRGLGNGLLGARFNVPGHLSDLATGDLDGDGQTDLMAHSFQHVLRFELGDGFQAGTSSQSTLDTPSVTTLADVDGDGIIDLVTRPPFQSGVVTIRLGLGDGSFGPSLDHPTGVAQQSVSLHFIDADGHPDLLIAGHSAVSVLLGLGAGLFGAPTTVTFPDPLSVASATAGDLDGDGLAEVIVARDTGVLSVFPGLGGGSLGAAVESTLGTIASQLELADLDGDGQPELLALDPVGGQVLALPGSGTTAFGTSYVIDLPGSNPTGMVLADVDTDGEVDLLCADLLDGLTVLLGLGDGTFELTAGPAVTPRLLGLHVDDLNGDGHLDVIGDGHFLVAVHLGRGDGTFTSATRFAMTGATFVADIDADGAPDLVDNADPVIVRFNQRP